MPAPHPGTPLTHSLTHLSLAQSCYWLLHSLSHSLVHTDALTVHYLSNCIPLTISLATYPIHTCPSQTGGFTSREEAFPRTMTGQFLRSMTLTGLVDEDWGKDAIEEIENVANKGHEGDTPEQPPFAKNKLFWMLAVNALAMGMALGLASIVFINIIDEVPKVWSDVDTHGGYDFEEEENVGFNDGKVRRVCLAAWLNGCHGCQVVD